MARAMRKAVEAGYEARQAGRIPRRLYAQASSPEEGARRAGAGGPLAVSAELERGEVDALAERWRAGWAGRRLREAAARRTRRYEDPVAVDLLRGVDALALLRRRAFARRSPTSASRPPRRRSSAARTPACPWRALGTHRGDIDQMLPATDRFMTIHGLHYLELTDGSVRRARGFFDLYDAATQLGLLPSRGGLGESALLLLRGFGVRRRPAT